MAMVDGKLLVMKCEHCYNTDYWSKVGVNKYRCHWCENVQIILGVNKEVR